MDREVTICLCIDSGKDKRRQEREQRTRIDELSTHAALILLPT